ncbi:MAG TPA: aspartate/glutamate racemase family protein [Sedimenticola thiotaurini]|uniref:Aspartate/glutamate racemase family protein n=1 Tax=Sedimenticola thiotaurini TaxID=1543721 RepID=A0A831W1X3_9GAMM|nr:aspartate/glutamate racemase family protein [Sedimenticola thiotaurini]
MKTIGLLGGMSWESTASYYRILNQETKRRLGGLHSASVVLHSVDFEPIERLQHAGRWDETARILASAARGVEAAGADFLLICTNTMHRVAPEIEAAVDIPLLHIADATGETIVQQGLKRVALLGTRFTMEQPFYRGRLEERFGLDVLVPDPAERERIHRVIYDELCLGSIRGDSRDDYLRIIAGLGRRGAEGVILGCTEIALLLEQEDTGLPLFDTTRLHALKAVDLALAGDTPG